MEREPKRLTRDEITVDVPTAEVQRLSEVSASTESGVQQRAEQALRLATHVRAQGYNVFVAGNPGTGRHALVERVLHEYTPEQLELRDICYVYNFRNPDSPRVLYFEPGEAREFKKYLHHLVENLKTIVKAKLESEVYTDQRDEIVAVIEQQENQVLADFEAKLSADGFEIVQVQEGDTKATDIMPRYQGERISFHELQNKVVKGEAGEQEWNSIREKYYHYMDEMKEVFKELRSNRRVMEEELEALRRETVKPDIHLEIERLREVFRAEKIGEYLDELETDLLDNLYLFTSDKRFTDEWGNPRLIRYGVNIIVDNSGEEHPPLRYENHPSYTNLFGTIDMQVDAGREIRSSFMLIKGGSLVCSSGGFLVLHAEDILQEKESWYHLKKILRTSVLELQHTHGQLYGGGPVMKPEPIDVDVKVIIIGTREHYDYLYHNESEFNELFKLIAEFDGEVRRSDGVLGRYIAFLKETVVQKGLQEITDSGISALIEYAVRAARHREKITTRFSTVADILAEASYWSETRSEEKIERADVEKAVEQQQYRLNMAEERIDDMIVSGELSVSCAGRAVGVVTGLGLMEQGSFTFARPIRISAQVSPGEKGVVNIEREAGLSGEAHDKGILVLEGYIRSKYAQDFPLSMYGSICFEQSYSCIDGDSASSAELFALLSSIARQPLRQDIAVTGSVDQMGNVHAVSGITEKVEGFFRVCKKLGLSGEQGVIIPEKNKNHLLINKEVAEAVEAGKFHIYVISSIDEGLEILSGRPAGRKTETSGYPLDTVNSYIEENLRLLADQFRAYTRS